MALVLKSWLAVKDYLAKLADAIPAEIVPAKLVKDLSKQVAYVDKTALAENPVALPQRPQVFILTSSSEFHLYRPMRGCARASLARLLVSSHAGTRARTFARSLTRST